MTKDIAIKAEVPLLGADWFDPLEAGIRQRLRSFIEDMLEEELAATLGRARYDRSAGAAGHRNGHRDRQLIGTFGPSAARASRCSLAILDADGLTGASLVWWLPVVPLMAAVHRPRSAFQ